MRSYVFVLLKTGPSKMPDGAERDEMYRGHFANMTRLSKEGKLVSGRALRRRGWLAGTICTGGQGIEEASALVATDPVIIKGEMVAEYHRYYGSAALMLVPEQSRKLARKKF
jgi:uncharacterized protein YciI